MKRFIIIVSAFILLAISNVYAENIDNTVNDNVISGTSLVSDSASTFNPEDVEIEITKHGNILKRYNCDFNQIPGYEHLTIDDFISVDEFYEIIDSYSDKSSTNTRSISEENLVDEEYWTNHIVYGYQLTGYASEIYDEMVYIFNADDPEYKVEDVVSNVGFRVIIKDNTKTLQQIWYDFATAYQTFLNDFPSIFWNCFDWKCYDAAGNRVYGDDSANIHTLDVFFTIDQDFRNPPSAHSSEIEYIKSIYNCVEDLIEDYNNEMEQLGISSDVLKFKYINDKLEERAIYEDETLGIAGQFNNQNPISALFPSISGETNMCVSVCRGYSRAYQWLCRGVGLTCITYSSLLGGERHSCNYAKIGNTWYCVDTTNNDVNNDIAIQYGDLSATYYSFLGRQLPNNVPCKYNLYNGTATLKYPAPPTQDYVHLNGVNLRQIDCDEMKFGDVDLNGIVNAQDISVLYQYVLNTDLPLTDLQKINGDANQDGVITSSDCAYISNMIMQ